MKSIFLGAAFIGLLLSITASHAEQFYKWTDDKGVVHYSQQPPKGTSSKPVQTHNIKSSRPSANMNTNNNASATAQAATEQEPEAQTKEPIKKIKKDPKLCAKAKNDAQTLRQKPIVRRNNKVMTIDEKNKALANLEEIIKLNC